MKYEVVCQNDRGLRVTVTVTAASDEQACNAALRTLNTWLAVSALPATIELPAPTAATRENGAPEERAPVSQPSQEIEMGRIVQKGTVIDWIEIHATRNGTLGPIAEALLAARERAAA